MLDFGPLGLQKVALHWSASDTIEQHARA